MSRYFFAKAFQAFCLLLAMAWLYFIWVAAPSRPSGFDEIFDTDPPKSVKNLVMIQSGGFSEHLAITSFEIAPQDFKTLIAGEHLSEINDADRTAELYGYMEQELKQSRTILGSAPVFYYCDLKPVKDKDDLTYSMYVILGTNKEHNRVAAAYVFWQ